VRALPFFPSDDSAIWLSRRDATLSVAVLDALGREPSTVLEIGVFRGAWSLTIAMNVPGATVFGIDPYPGGEFLQSARAQALRSFADGGISHRFHLFATWDEFLATPERPTVVDVVHVDGRHDEVHAELDLENAHRLLADDGVIIVDDYRHISFPGIPSAMYRFLERRNYRIFLVSENKAFLCRTPHHGFWHSAFGAALAAQQEFTWYDRSSTGARAPESSAPSPPDVLGAAVLLCIPPYSPVPSPATPSLRRRVASVARDWLPPIAVRALWRARERWRTQRAG
jgi:predicted O-methyltransferase YrrM